MKILILCGAIGPRNEQEAMSHARGTGDIAANLFQQKIISGFRALDCDCSVLSAPFLGAYPMGSDLISFRGFSQPEPEYQYVRFNNIWGIRSISRAASLKKALAPFIRDPDPQKLILVYCPHTPFLQAAVYAKQQDPSIRLCLYVPDLPHYMNLNANRSIVYDIAKKYDIKALNALMLRFDAFVLLTDQMKEMLPIEGKPYRVAEGIIDEFPQDTAPKISDSSLRHIVYTGKLNESFGVKDLIDGFTLLPDPDCRLVLCGRGDCEAYARKMQETDPRIACMGLVSPGDAKAWQQRASVLVNPRSGAEAYTRYSFPSKNIEYLLTGNPVVGYFLEGMPEAYRDFMHCIDPARPAREAIAEALSGALHTDSTEAQERSSRFLAYARANLSAEAIAKSVIGLIKSN